MSVHPRRTKKGLVFDVRWRDAAGKNRGRTFDLKDDAIAYDLTQRRSKRMGAFAPSDPSPELLWSFLERWFSTGTWAMTTRRSRAQLIDKWIVPFIGDVPLRQLGRQRVREFRAEIINAGSPPTNTNNVMAVLSSALTVAVDDGLIPYNPCHRIGKVPTQRPQRRAYPPEVVDALYRQMPTDRDRVVFGLLRHGLRPAEVVGMQWRDIDDGIMTVYDTVQEGQTVATKTGVFRAIPIEEPLESDLANLDRYHSDDYVVAGAQGGPLNWKMWTRRGWTPARKAVGTDAVPYSLRHTRASELIVTRRMDPANAAALMGHSTRVMLDHYVHLFQAAHARDARSALEEHEKR